MESFNLNLCSKGLLRTSYNIYGPQGLVGFSIINKSDLLLEGIILLFESKTKGTGTAAAETPEMTIYYPLQTSEIFILKDLISRAIPDSGTGNFPYVVKKGAEIIDLS